MSDPTSSAVFPSCGADTPAPLAPPRPYVSFSALNLYRQCPLRYRFRYVDGLPEPWIPAALVFGGAIHAAVQRYFEERLAGHAAPLGELLAAYRQHWDAETHDRDVRFAAGEDAAALHQHAERILGAFLESPAARPVGRIIGVEEEMLTPLDSGMPPLLARIDLLIDTGRTLRVVDLKTARSRWSHAQVEQAAEQVWLYALAVESLIPRRRLELEFLVITKTRQPDVQPLAVPWDPSRAERVRTLAHNVWKAITAGVFYPAPSPLACPSCPFQEHCRAWPAGLAQ